MFRVWGLRASLGGRVEGLGVESFWDVGFRG